MKTVHRMVKNLKQRRIMALAVACGAALLPWQLLRGTAAAGKAARAQQEQEGKTGPIASIAAYIDMHAHLDPADPQGSVEEAMGLTAPENLMKVVFMPSPFTLQDVGRYDSELIFSVARKYPERIAVMGGGGTLNPMIIEAARTGEDSPELRKNFKERAERILAEGCVGFGEMTAEHFAGGTPYQYAPADHPLYLLLADIAAQHDVPISIHMEAVPQDMDLPGPLKSPPNAPRLHANIAAFERLLAHNPHAKIIWAHLGWDNTGYRTPELMRKLLKAHPNLYMEIKIDPVDVGKNSPLMDGGSGKIKASWLKLVTDFPDRFVMGTDQHYPMPEKGPQRWQADVLLLNQLPVEPRRRIAFENAMKLYRLK